MSTTIAKSAALLRRGAATRASGYRFASSSSPAASSSEGGPSSTPNSASPEASTSSSTGDVAPQGDSRPQRPVRPAGFVAGQTSWGPTSQSTIATKPSDIPYSHRILPLTPNPTPPWASRKFVEEGDVGGGVYHINYPRPMFSAPKPEHMPEILGGNQSKRRMMVLSAVTGLQETELADLRRITAKATYVSTQTKKGSVRSALAYVVVGDPKKGMLGFGRGKGTTFGNAIDKAFFQACVEMDAVDRYEGRTLWGQGAELVSKFGASIVSLRARPPGHGLQVPHSVHRILTACGIRDASAQIDGSKDPITVMKAVVQLLHGGANPAHLGTGTGNKGKRENKGAGMRSKDDIQRQRGRYGVDVGLRV